MLVTKNMLATALMEDFFSQTGNTWIEKKVLTELFKKKGIPKLTSREVDIMNILWENEKPLIASEIADARPDLTINTVQAVLRKLLKYQLIEVADIVYSGTVLSRSYRPTITSEEFAVLEVTSDYLAFEKTLSKPLLVSALLDTEEDPVKARETIDELQKMLDEYKKTLEEQEP